MPRTLNPQVEGSSPSRPTSEIKGIGPLGTDYRPTGVEHGVGTPPGFVVLAPPHLADLARKIASAPVGSVVPTGANQAGQLDLFPETRHPGL